MLAEGLAQAVVVVRSNLNPVISRLIFADQKGELAEFGRRVSIWIFLFMAAAGLLLVIGFAASVHILFADPSFGAAVLPLGILVVGLAVASFYLPFGMVFSQAGHPLLQTMFSCAVLGVNALLNGLLIHVAGINGAAIGTAMSYLATALLLVVLMRRVYRIKIWL
jgi:Na+-driven multidrug efflux pump